MNNILVSGASGIVGYGILRALKTYNNELNLVGTSIYDDSVAENFCDIFEKAIPTSDDSYIDWLISTIRKFNISMLIPGIEDDLYKWSEFKDEINKSGAVLLLNNIDLINFCKDKWLFFLELKKNNNPYLINTTLENDFDILVNNLGIPFLLKPRKGYASRGLVKINNRTTFDLHKDNIGKSLMAQEYVGNENEEYTTSVFGDGRGGFFTMMTLRRKLSKDGFTDRAETFESPIIIEAIIILCKEFKPIGPTNFQFRLHNGRLKLLEINPRISSSTSIRTALGYNESAMAVRYFLDNKIPVQPIVKRGKAVRFIEDKITFYDRSNF
jgi:carbamoyl-phosphate synthase large subunit